MLSKSRVRTRPSVLWCYKKDLGFSTYSLLMVCYCSHKKKRMREIKKLISRGLYDKDGENPFDLFVSSTEIRWCYYKESKIWNVGSSGFRVHYCQSSMSYNRDC